MNHAIYHPKLSPSTKGTLLSKIIHPFIRDKKMTPMELYNRYVKECRKKRLPDIIENYSLEHGRLIVKHLIEFATEHKLPIHMISGALHEAFWSPLIESLEKYFIKVDKKSSLNIIIINAYKANLDNNSVYNFLHNTALLPRVVIHEGINQNIVTSQPHFFLVGEEAYRKEENQNRAVATASFHDPNNGKKLLETFSFISDYIRNPSLLTNEATQSISKNNHSENKESLAI